jgi:hypothetical protein
VKHFAAFSFYGIVGTSLRLLIRAELGNAKVEIIGIFHILAKNQENPYIDKNSYLCTKSVTTIITPGER